MHVPHIHTRTRMGCGVYCCPGVKGLGGLPSMISIRSMKEEHACLLESSS